MKRAALAVLILSLVALPAAAAAAHKMPLTTARCVILEHVPGAWRMQIACDQGRGSIIRLDSQQFRGDGMFAGWSQKDMRALFESLIPHDEDKAYLESPQLG